MTYSNSPTDLKEVVAREYNNIVFPITLAKFFLNKKKILKFHNDEKIKIFEKDNAGCNECEKTLIANGKKCRNHTSIDRVLAAEDVLYDVVSGFFFSRNEIFKFDEEKKIWTIIYCPHTKLIIEPLNNKKVRKITMIKTDLEKTISSNKKDPEKPLSIKNIIKFNSNELSQQSLLCWFNCELSLVLKPEREYMNFILITNH